MASVSVSIIGDGGWGTTLAILLCRKGFRVTLWGVFPEYVAQLRERKENSKFLKGIPIPAGIRITSSLEEALSGSHVVVLAVPSRYMRDVLKKLKSCAAAGQVFVSVTKGIENKTLMRMSEVMEDVLGAGDIAVLSGPSIAIEVARGIPTTLVASAKHEEIAEKVRDIFITERLRVYTSPDVTGVELGGSLKNIIAIAAGMSDGMKLGANTKAALLTRGLAEVRRLGVAMGAQAETFSGLSGMGDMITTCVSADSRNRWFGEQLAKGKGLRDIRDLTEMVIEGITTTRSAYNLAEKYEVEMPITSEMYKVIYKEKDPKETVKDLMTRSPKAEIW